MTEILQAAGFADVTFTDVHEPVYYGPDVAAALDWVRGFTCTSEALKRLDPAAADRAVGRLREALAAHRATTVSGSTPAPGSSPLIAGEREHNRAEQPRHSCSRPTSSRVRPTADLHGVCHPKDVIAAHESGRIRYDQHPMLYASPYQVVALRVAVSLLILIAAVATPTFAVAVPPS